SRARGPVSAHVEQFLVEPVWRQAVGDEVAAQGAPEVPGAAEPDAGRPPVGDVRADAGAAQESVPAVDQYPEVHVGCRGVLPDALDGPIGEIAGGVVARDLLAAGCAGMGPQPRQEGGDADARPDPDLAGPVVRELEAAIRPLDPRPVADFEAIPK